MSYKDILDSHTHTVASGHAYSTINEMIASAQEKKLEILGITEHAPMMPGSCHEIYFANFRVLPRKRGNLHTVFGVELNIMNGKGEVDMPQDMIETLDVVIASLHPNVYLGNAGCKGETLAAYLHVMENPYVNIIGHPDDGRFPVDYEALVKSAKEHHKLIELNNASLNPKAFRVGARENDLQILKYCMKYETPIILDSDAHIDVDVAKHEYCHAILEEVGFPKELVVNTDPDLYFSYINYKNMK